jgi:hypothetical protein
MDNSIPPVVSFETGCVLRTLSEGAGEQVVENDIWIREGRSKRRL